MFLVKDVKKQVINLYSCPACGWTHNDIIFRPNTAEKLRRMGYTHEAACPNGGKAVYMKESGGFRDFICARKN